MHTKSRSPPSADPSADLHHVVDLGLDELEQHVDALLRSRLDRHSAAPDRAHRLAHKVDVHLLQGTEGGGGERGGHPKEEASTARAVGKE
eukprot:269979-Chlamydomonas_euryale.AAC.1